MEFKQIATNKKQFLDLLLLADEQESMIDKYLEPGEMFALYDGDLKTICVVTKENEGVYEHCGFTISHRIPNFFTHHYDHQIYEGGKQLVDMVYLKKEL